MLIYMKWQFTIINFLSSYLGQSAAFQEKKAGALDNITLHIFVQ